MAAAEIPFEYLYSVQESTRGTAIATPTRNLGVAATMTPTQEWYEPEDSRGTLVKSYRQLLVREASQFEIPDHAIDLNTFHHYCAGAVKGGVTGSLVETGVYSWVFTPSITSDDLKSYTLYWGDPNAQIWQAPYCMIDELKITANGSGTDAVMFSAMGTGQKMVEVSAPSAIAIGTQYSLPPSRMDYYMDAAGGSYGSTSITSRILDVEITIPTEIKYKFGPVGAAGSGGNTFRRIGRDKRQVEMKITMELLDTTQTDLFLAGTVMKHRARFSTEALIGSTQRGFINLDIYGYLRDLEWGDLEGVNRTVSFTVKSMYESSLSADFALTVQNGTSTV
jgi:hypothetical protein